jgi:intracellular septation protein
MAAWMEWIPLVIFYVGYRQWDLMVATALLVVSTLLVAGVTYLRERRVPVVLLSSTLLVAVLGGMSLWFQDARFIKMKPTLVSLLFSGILWVSFLRRRYWIAHVLRTMRPLPEGLLRVLTVRFGIFFLAMAVANEWVWRHHSEDVWVMFKVFGFSSAALVFTMLQMPLLWPYLKPEEEVDLEDLGSSSPSRRP